MSILKRDWKTVKWESVKKCMKHIQSEFDGVSFLMMRNFLTINEKEDEGEEKQNKKTKKLSSMQWVSFFEAENLPKWPNLYPWAAAEICVGSERTRDTDRGRRRAPMVWSVIRGRALSTAEHKGKGGLKDVAYLSLDFRMTAGWAALLPDSFIP